MSDLKRLPTSRAYWELKAEQMMNRVFDPDQTIDLQIDPVLQSDPVLQMDPDVAPSPHRPPAGGPTPWTGRSQRTSQATASDPPDEVVPPSPNPSGHPPSPWLWLALAGMGMVSTIAALLFVQQWTHLQQGLSQERSLLMVERLRSLGPANPEPMPSQVQVLTTPAAPSLDTVVPRTQPLVTPGPQAVESAAPPPPPEEPWMQQLSELPQAAPPKAPLLKVPLSPKLARVIPATSPAAPGPMPQLVGLVAAPGKPGSAIFQIGATSTSVNVGETIGGTGWRLRSTDAESALVEREGVARRLAIVGGG